MSFKNKRYFTKQAFDILSSSLKVERKGLFDAIEYEIPFDNIYNKKTIQTQINNNLVVTGFFFFVFSFLSLLGSSQQLTVIFLTIGVILALIAFINRKRIITIATYAGEGVTLYFSNKNKTEVLEFANKIIEASNSYLLSKYSKIDRTLPIDHLQFLRNGEIITEDHFEILKKSNSWAETGYQLLDLDNKNVTQQSVRQNAGRRIRNLH